MIPWFEGLPFQVKYSSETVAFDQGNVLDYASVSEIIFSVFWPDIFILHLQTCKWIQSAPV